MCTYNITRAISRGAFVEGQVSGSKGTLPSTCMQGKQLAEWIDDEGCREFGRQISACTNTKIHEESAKA